MFITNNFAVNRDAIRLKTSSRFAQNAIGTFTGLSTMRCEDEIEDSHGIFKFDFEDALEKQTDEVMRDGEGGA
jgi:hypothetical protein